MEEAQPLSLVLPSSRELGALLQDEMAQATGLSARWAAESLMGNRSALAQWTVPFGSDEGHLGRFILRWTPELQGHLAARLGVAAARPEFMGMVLRGTASRWAGLQASQGLNGLSLQASPEPEDSAPAARPQRCCAALLLDGHVLELTFELDQASA
jgi:hypothetical protein